MAFAENEKLSRGKNSSLRLHAAAHYIRGALGIVLREFDPLAAGEFGVRVSANASSLARGTKTLFRRSAEGAGGERERGGRRERVAVRIRGCVFCEQQLRFRRAARVHTARAPTR